VNALREIRHYQKQAGTIIPRAASMRLVRELLDELSLNVTHISASAHACLQHATEAYIVTFFELMYDILITQLTLVITPQFMPAAKLSLSKIVCLSETLCKLSTHRPVWHAVLPTRPKQKTLSPKLAHRSRQQPGERLRANLSFRRLKKAESRKSTLLPKYQSPVWLSHRQQRRKGHKIKGYRFVTEF